MKRYYLALLAAVLLSSSASAQLLVEDFDFNGALNANGWNIHSTNFDFPISTVTGLTYPGYWGSGIGNAAAIVESGEDVHKTYSAVTSGSLYLSFLMKSESLPPTNYFMHLSINPTQNLNSQWRGRIFQAPPSGSGDYELGISYAHTSPAYTTTMDLQFGQTYLVVMRYDVIAGADNDEVSLWVFETGVPATEPAPTLGPTSASAESLTGEISPASIALRQYSTDQHVIVDGIRIGTTWATSTLPVELDVFGVE